MLYDLVSERKIVIDVTFRGKQKCKQGFAEFQFPLNKQCSDISANRPDQMGDMFLKLWNHKNGLVSV